MLSSRLEQPGFRRHGDRPLGLHHRDLARRRGRGREPLCGHTGLPFAQLPLLGHLCAHGSRHRTPEDLKGKRVGIPEYQITAAVWSRGFLSDEYKVKAEDLVWMQGGMDDPGRKDKWPNNLPAGFPLHPLPEGRTINDMLAKGELDAFIGPRTPTSYRDGKTPLRRLFENFEEVEKDYYRRSGIFPIMHPLGLRRQLYEKHPWLALNIYLAFAQAKRISQAELFETAALKIGLPWAVSSALSAQEVLGPDIFPYGVASSRRTLEAAIRYSMEQHMAVRAVTIEELFPPNTLDEPKM